MSWAVEAKRALREGTFLCMSHGVHRVNLREKIALFRTVYHVMSCVFHIIFYEDGSIFLRGSG